MTAVLANIHVNDAAPAESIAWFAEDSIWRTPISDYTLDENSAFHVAYRLATGIQIPKFIAGPEENLGTYDYNHPIYFAEAGDPQFEVTLEEEWDRSGEEIEIEGDTIRCPTYALPAGGSDGHMAVVQPDGTTYDFWECDAPAAGVLNARWGGRSDINGSGLWSNATAALFALGAGIIRPEELLAGVIDHPLFTVDAYCNGTVRAPAHGNGGRIDAAETALGAPPMGAHWFLDISDPEINSADEWARPILRALRDYGWITGDTGGGAFKLDTARESPETDRWITVIDYFGLSTDVDGNATFDLSSYIDWDSRLHLLAEGS